ncbi:UPF0149 family protein [Ideonella sp. BN130291]|uniref:UPF0149 family protein n=1 Tax=Ideonella sp. BN130291 TaxID=3112940 RepID=UPI002E26260E|nr:UPF0149 family protein [Ideonella sp. BN130291]
MEYPQYNPQIADQPLTDEELQALDELLQAVPGDNAMNVEGLDGYLTALLVGPPLLTTLRTADWLPAVWGGDGEGNAPFASGKQRKRATVLVLRHLQSIHCQLRDHPDHWQPVFSVAETKEREVVDAEDWCVGFLQAVALAPDRWEPLFDDPQLGAALVPVALLGGDESELSPADRERLADPEQRDELSRAAMDAVLLLNERRHTP